MCVSWGLAFTASPASVCVRCSIRCSETLGTKLQREPIDTVSTHDSVVQADVTHWSDECPKKTRNDLQGVRGITLKPRRQVFGLLKLTFTLLWFWASSHCTNNSKYLSFFFCCCYGAASSLMITPSFKHHLDSINLTQLINAHRFKNG